MSMPPFDIKEVLRMLFDSCLHEGSQKQWAEKHKISSSYLSDVLRGNREPGDSILKVFGLRKVVTYDYEQYSVCESSESTKKRNPKKEAHP